MDIFQFYSRLMAMMDRLYTVDINYETQIMHAHQSCAGRSIWMWDVWAMRWTIRQFQGTPVGLPDSLPSPQFARSIYMHRIPAVVTPQDCRHLFLMESHVAGFSTVIPMRNAAVLVDGVRVPIRWDPLPDGSYICSPV